MSADFVLVGLTHYVLLSALLFAIGLFGVITRRNAVAVLMSIEIMLNAVILALVSFNRFVAPADTYNGQIFAIFIIAVAAGEAAVGLALMITIYRSRDTINVEDMNLMRW